MKRAILLLFLSGLLAGGYGWHNNYDEPMDFKCPQGQSITTLKSENSNYYKDRRWEFTCKSTYSQSGDCFLSPYVNNFNKMFTFECPAQHVIAGISSYHSNFYEDRRWQFYCCRTKCLTGSNGNCQWTSHVNAWDQAFEWTVPPQTILVGVESYHSNLRQDRRWKYKYCVRQCQ